MSETFLVKDAGYHMQAKITVVSRDLFIEVTGGDDPHIGTVTTLTKNTDPETIRFPSHDGRFHKDDVLAMAIGKIIQPQLPGNCVITVGVHVDHITQAQIDASADMAKCLGNQISDWLKTAVFTAKEPVYYQQGEIPPEK